MASYLRSHRKRSGLSRRELADVLGVIDTHQIGRHERGTFLPTLLVAVRYEIVFSTPISELFPAVYEALRHDIEERLAALEADLQQSSIKGRGAARIARRLEWLCERRNPEMRSQLE